MKTGFAIILVLLLVTSARAESETDPVPQHAIEGSWERAQPQGDLPGRLVSIDIMAKTISFSWKGQERLEYLISDITEDAEIGMPRYTLVLRGKAGKISLTILAFSESTLYLGQLVPRDGIAIWGTYSRVSLRPGL